MSRDVESAKLRVIELREDWETQALEREARAHRTGDPATRAEAQVLRDCVDDLLELFPEAKKLPETGRAIRSENRIQEVAQK